MSCVDHPDALTPNLDRLAGESVRFERAFCQSPVCVPARGSIITGLYPNRHGARVLRDPLPADVRTIAHHFKDHGYTTAAIGKMHFVNEKRRHGFDHRIYIKDFYQTLTEDEKQILAKDQDQGRGENGAPSDLPARFYRDNFYTEKAVEYLHTQSNTEQPFCAWVSFFMPHTPLVPMREYYERYDPAKLQLPHRASKALQNGFEGHLIRARERGWYDQDEASLRNSLTGYYGNISQMDNYVGRVLQALEDAGLAEDTIVVYTSDHGEMAGAHRMWTKHIMFEDAIRVPLMIRLPDKKKSGTVHSELIEHVDLYPTLCELCGLPTPAAIDGRSFAPLMRDGNYTPRTHIYSQYDFCHNVFTADDRYVGQPPIITIRTERWKLNHLNWGKPELFDLVNDPNEDVNLIDDTTHTDRVKALTAQAQKIYESERPSR